MPMLKDLKCQFLLKILVSNIFCLRFIIEKLILSRVLSIEVVTIHKITIYLYLKRTIYKFELSHGFRTKVVACDLATKQCILLLCDILNVEDCLKLNICISNLITINRCYLNTYILNSTWAITLLK